MATILLTQASSGAPTLSGTNGTLCTVLDWALVQNGWAIEYTAANNRIYRAGTGNRRRLFVNHDSAVTGDARLALLRGCENATAAGTGTLTDPFPTVAQVANASSTVLVSTTAAATARNYVIVLSPTHFVMATNCAGANNANWDLFGFGDLAGVDAADTWATFVMVGGTTIATGTSSRFMASAVASTPLSSGKVFFCRSVDGSIKSTHGCIHGCSQSGVVGMGQVLNTPAMQGGYGNRIVREKTALNCLGSATTTAGALSLVRRGWVPNLWLPIHSTIGGVTSDDVFHDVGGTGNYQIAPAASTISAILETTDTWAVPSG